MEPSCSIVSFNNDSTLKPEYGGAGGGRDINVHELALHAMRDRCLLLQRRIHSLENDNMRLKIESSDREPYRPLEEGEKRQLHLQLADLTKQKAQLMHHVFMVTCENKNLWNRLAGLKRAARREIAQSNYSALQDSPQKQARLLRTNTYIHSTPRVDVGLDKFSETSLEEISLKLINSYIQEKSQLVEQYEQMTEMQSEDVLNMDSIGFAYLEEPGTDSLKEIRSQTEKLLQLKKEISQQEAELAFILSNLEKIFSEGIKCSDCTKKQNGQTTTENKEIETSDSLAEWATPADSNTDHENSSEMTGTGASLSQREPNGVIDLQPQHNDEQDKMCPMCGTMFKKGCSFAEFQQHVENHFVGDPEPDSIIDNYELVTTSVDNNYI